MQQIADWLEKLGMSEYAKAFADNGIDVSVLPHLFDQDLKDIGVLLGHRRKMLAAIAELVRGIQAPLQSAMPEAKPQDTAERQKCVAGTVQRFGIREEALHRLGF
jgi:SAM domain (Sterile alpha motif)